MLTKGARALPEDRVASEEEIKDPYVLELLDLEDEYSENNPEELSSGTSRGRPDRG